MPEVLLEERQIFRRELVLERLRCGRDNRLLARDDRGDEVCERLAGARARLHDEVSLVGDRLRDGVGHLTLPLATFAARRDLVDDAVELGTH